MVSFPTERDKLINKQPKRLFRGHAASPHSFINNSQCSSHFWGCARDVQLGTPSVTF